MTEKTPKAESKTKAPSDKQTQRVKLFKILGATVGALGMLYGLYYYFLGATHVSTDNAYVGAEIAQVTPSVGGTVKSIAVKDTDLVKKDDVLVVLDDADTRLALSRAQATLAMAEADWERTKLDYKRRTNLANTGSVSAEEVSNAANAFKAAQAALDGAKVAVEQAQMDLARTVIRSPVEGVVAKRQVQLGQRVHVGTPLLCVVPLAQLHVNANFKEVQVRKIRIGQPVTMQADIYGSAVTYNGKVEGVSGGTGAAFAVIPAQNATGNWIKVVQRLPVRISLDPEQLKAHPLQVGLSMEVHIDLSDH